MINRVFKTIFILSLCLGITIPSNAAGVDVSDGSAFITKSEMSYQLNNLSNRMTQLENSLDSKIDKLVSSFLTRNGIWNGVKQTLAKAYTESWYHFTTDNDFNIARLNYPARFEYPYWSYVRETTSEGSSPFCTSNKSGLMLINMEIVGNIYNRCYFKKSDSAGASAGAGSLLWKFYVNNNLASSVTFGTASSIRSVGEYASYATEDQWIYIVQRVIGIFDQKLTCLFFVNKGDAVTYDIVLSMMWGNSATMSNISSGTGGPDRFVGGNAYVNDCVVY